MSTWMVVEDEPDIYEVLLAMFEMWGIDGTAFIDGEEAVAWIEDVDRGKFSGELPELALLDIRLPGAISGPMVGERLRQSPSLKNITIVLTTAYYLSNPEEKAFMDQAAADRLIYKPLPKFEALKQLLEDLIAKRRADLLAATDQPAVVLSPPPAQPATMPVQPPPTPAEPKPARKSPSTTRRKYGRRASKNDSSARPPARPSAKDIKPENEN